MKNKVKILAIILCAVLLAVFVGCAKKNEPFEYGEDVSISAVSLDDESEKQPEPVNNATFPPISDSGIFIDLPGKEEKEQIWWTEGFIDAFEGNGIVITAIGIDPVGDFYPDAYDPQFRQTPYTGQADALALISGKDYFQIVTEAGDTYDFRVHPDDKASLICAEMRNPHYVTERGLRIGGNVEKLLESYDQAIHPSGNIDYSQRSHIISVPVSGTYEGREEGDPYITFKLLDGVITSIMLGGRYLP